VVDSPHPTTHEVRLIPELRTPRVTHEARLLLLVWQRARPSLQRAEVPPVLAHVAVRSHDGEDHVLVQEEPAGSLPVNGTVTTTLTY